MVRLHNLKTVHHEKGHWVAVSRSGELGVIDEFGRERERYKIPYGAKITSKMATVASRTGLGYMGSAYASGYHRSGGFHQVPRLHRWHDCHEQVDDVTGLVQHCRDGSKATQFQRQRFASSRALVNAKGKELFFREHRDSGCVLVADRRVRQLGRRRESICGRRYRTYPARVVRRPAISPAVCRVLPICSRLVSLKIQRFLPSNLAP